MAERSVTRDMPKLSLRATFDLSTIDVDARTVELTWTTGAPVLRGFFEPYYEKLSLDPKHVRMGRLQSGAAPVLDAHNSGRIADVIGVVESADLQKKRGVAKVRFDTGPEGEEAFRKVREKILRNVSIGYSTYRMEKVEGGDATIPTYEATDWEPAEISMVPVGADAGAVTRSGSDGEGQGGAPCTPCVFVTRTAIANKKDKVMDDDDTEIPTPAPQAAPSGVAIRAANEADAAVTAANKALRAARTEEAAQRAADRHDAAERALEQERKRTAHIRKLSRTHKLGDAWASNLIEAGVSETQATQAALDAVGERQGAEITNTGGGSLVAGDDERDKYIRGTSAWLIERTGTRSMIEAAAKKCPDAFKGVTFDGGEHRGFSPREIARKCVERAGINTSGMDPMRIIGLAFTTRSTSYQTTGDFPNILENVLGKVLLGAYMTQASTWQRFCGTDTVPDFRTSNRYRTGSLPSLEVIAEHGEYKSGAIPDAAKYALTTQRMGKMFAVSQETIINDDMGALAQMATEIGRSGMRTIENAVYALLALNSGLGPTQGDGQAFFHANRSNVNATGSALSVAGIDADRVVLRAQKDPNSLDFLDLTPDRLLVPDALSGTARVINNAQFDPDTVNKLQRPNMVQGLFSDIIGTPRLAASSTRRYLFCDPSIAAAIVVAYLEGYGQGPTMDSQTGWRVDGVEWKVSLYAKAQMGDPKAAVTNAGV